MLRGCQWILVFWCQRSFWNSNGVTPVGTPNTRGIGKICDLKQTRNVAQCSAWSTFYQYFIQAIKPWLWPYFLSHFSLILQSSSLFMVALWNRADHYIFILWFLSIYLSSFFSSPNLRGCTVDVYHTSTHGVALGEFKMQVCNVLHAARWKYRMQKSPQKSPSGHHRTTLSGCISVTKACIDNWKILVKQQYVLQMCSQYGELCPTSG